MSASVNKVIIVGNLTADPELNHTSSGKPVCNLRVATNEVWKDKDGELRERAEFHQVVVWGNQAEPCGKYLSKGRQVYVEGKLQTRSWEDKDGNKRYTTEVNATDVKFLGSARDNDNTDSAPPDKPATKARGGVPRKRGWD